jgi:sterol desaturase/sphingolipid hydroxylase (fatty acid hydroxylase superfamily)
MITATVFAGPVFLFLIAVELWVAKRRHKRIAMWKDSTTSVTMGTVYALIAIGPKAFLLGVGYWIYQYRIFDIGTGVAAWIALIVAEDFCYYWFHRSHHEVRILWASHIAHHSSQYYNLATALRQSWTSSLTGAVFWLPLPLIGFDPLMVAAMQQVSLIYQFWIHTETIDRLGPLETVMNTPSHHRVHHATNERYLDRNYAGIFIIWDKLFGTFEAEDDAEAVIFGLTHNINTFNPISVAFHEWAACLTAAVTAPTWKQGWMHLTQPPNWVPGEKASSLTT